ncbi:hypothetical protein [Micromonospora sp. KC213]|uniref:hypothetical protein n=1 Tax=Micromonospora sp. KC213 TaxID=2530378 RepID=UPI00104E0797|nr:hypothetical protein [Micromonospora sp. KC213]TDC43293.1 hypothetical protein E1166_04700 [Micromonospora sp. KC213]
MGDGEAADVADLGGPDFAPVIPPADSSVVGAPPPDRGVVLGPGFRGHVVLPRAARPAPPPAGSGSDPAQETRQDRPAEHRDHP